MVINLGSHTKTMGTHLHGSGASDHTKHLNTFVWLYECGLVCNLVVKSLRQLNVL